MRRVQRLLLSAGLACLATTGFVLAVGARQDALLILLFAGFWIGLHAFIGFVRLSQRLDRVARLKLLSTSEYDRLRR